MATLLILERHVTVLFLLQRSTAFHILILLLKFLKKGSPCSKASDIFSLGKILYKVGTRFDIPVLVSTAQKCLDANPARRPTNTGIMATLASEICD